MADFKSSTPLIEGGVYSEDYKTNLTGRQNPILGTIRDSILETTAGAIDVLATPYAYGRDYGASTGDKKYEVAGQLGQRTASQLKDFVRSGKTDYGRQEDKNGGENATWLSNVAEALPPSLPAMGVAALTGWAAPATYGALAHGQQSQQFEELLYNMPREQLEQLPLYEKFKGQGMTHEDAMRAMHAEMRADPAATLPNVIANVTFGGIGSHLVGKIGSRSLAQTMKDRIISRVLPDVAEAVGGAAVTGVGQSWGRQAGDITIGTRDQYDLGEMAEAGKDMAMTVGPLGMVSGLSHLRGPKKPAAAGGTTGSLINDANKKPAPAIGTEQRIVATDNLKGNNIGDEVTPPAPKPGEERAPINPEGSTAQVNRPAEINPEGSTAQVTPAGSAPPLKGSGLGIIEAFEDLKGGGISEHFYNQAFQRYNEGTARVAGAVEPILQRALNQGIKFASPDELRQYFEAEIKKQGSPRPVGPAPGATTWTDVDPTRPSEPMTPAAEQAYVDITAPPGVDMADLAHQRRSLDAASPDQKSSLEWREESQRIDQEIARATQEHARAAAAPTTPTEAAAPPAAAGPTPTPPAAAGVEGHWREAKPDEVFAPGRKFQMDVATGKNMVWEEAAAAAPKMTLDELKARAHELGQQGANIDAMNAIIKEYKDQHGLKKVPEHSQVTQAWSEGKAKATKAATDQREAERKAARETKRTQQAEEKAQRDQAKAEKKAEAEHMGLAKKQAQGFAKKAREQAEALKRKPKAEQPEEKVTQEGKATTETKDATPTKAPPAEEATTAAEAKPAGETTPPEAKADPDLIRRKLGLKPLGAQEVTHGKAAAPVIAKLTEERQLKGAQAWDPKTRRQTEEAKKGARAAAKQASREEQTNIREGTARQTMEDHKPRDNYAAELDRVEGAIKDGKADAPEVKGHIAQVVADVKEMVADYKERINTLAGGKAHPVFRFAEGKGFEVTKEGKEKAASKSRSGKGEYHNFLGEMGNYLDKVERALKRGDGARAKELTLRYLENSRLVREGEIKQVTESRRQASDEVGAKKKTDLGGDRQIEMTEHELAKIRFEDEHAKDDDVRTTRVMDDAELRRRGWSKPLFKGPSRRMDELDLPYNERAQDLYHAALDLKAERGDEHIRVQDATDLGERMGEKVTRTTLGDLMKPHRPKNAILGMIFDRVHAMVKDMPAHVWTDDMMEAFDPESAAFYNPGDGVAVFRPGTFNDARVVFHEALHAATSRAIDGSERLTHLLSRLQDYIEDYYKNDHPMRDSEAHYVAIRRDGERVNPHEFISELFTRNDVSSLVKGVELSPAQIKELTDAGYQVDKGKSLLKTWWNSFLKAIGFKPSAIKVAVDALQDVFEREMQFRARDTALGLTDIGRVYSMDELAMLAKEDPVHGTAARAAILSGNHATAATRLVAMADKMSPKTADASIKYLHGVNESLWGGQSLPSRVPSLSSPEKIRTEVATFLGDRFGEVGKNLGFNIEKGFGTKIRNFVSGMSYTNDIGSTLEQAFQNVLKPLKDAWSRREHHAQKYMDTSGANQLIDKIATMKNSITDRPLWQAFENLLIRESYARTRADEELGVGANAHIKIGDLRDRQSVQDHAKNRAILEAIGARNPDLLKLRNEIFDFTKNEQVARHKATVRDMLLQMKQVDHGDELAISGLTKDVIRDNKSITAAERAAVDRALKLGKESDAWKNHEKERDRLEHSVGKADPAYKKHEARGAKLLTELGSKQYDAYKKNREDIRKIVDPGYHHGPHVPFMRHGTHAVYSEFDITPDKGVKYNEVDPTADLHKQYDFAKREDAEHFIDNTLSHEAVNVTVNNAYEVVYDTRTGERAGVWTVERPDRTATTYESRAEAEAAKGEKDKLTKRNLMPDDVAKMKDDGLATGHYETRHRVVFNPKEFVKFENERAAHEYRDQLAGDSGHPNMVTRTSNVESEHEMVGRANVAYTSAEMKQWINRHEASPEYQAMDPSQKAEWARKLRVEAARVTATAGRRTSHMPRDYARGASTDLLKGMIEFGGSNARAIADLTYRSDIDKGLADAQAYVSKYRNQSGGLGKDHRARDDALIEIKKRLFEPPKVEGSWAIAVKRALQVSMISHLADLGYLAVNAIEPWVMGAAITASRHGWAPAYAAQIEATKLVNLTKHAGQIGSDLKEAWSGKFGGANPYEKLLQDQVKSTDNTRGDGLGLGKMLDHMFNRGLAARDVGMEVERIHDPSKNKFFRGLDWLDGLFRAANSGVETVNRATMAIGNYRLEYDRAIKEMGLPANTMKTVTMKDGTTHITGDYVFNQKAHDQAVRYAEDAIFKGAGDYSSWNNPRYFNNPMMKLAGQFKKYPLRIASLYMDAMMGSVKGDPQKMKQLAYMLIAQSVAAGGMGLPIISPAAGLTNALYILGITDSTWDDVELAIRKGLVDHIGVGATDLAMHGALRFSGADFSTKMAQDSFLFRGSPGSRKPGDLIKSLGLAFLGAPGHMGENYLNGIQKTSEAISDVSAGAHTQGMVKGMQAADGLLQIKLVSDIMRAGGMMMGGIKGAPSTQKATWAQAGITALGFQPTSLADQRAAKAAVNLEKKRDSEWRNRWVNTWRDAPDKEKSAIWAKIQRENQGVDNPALRIQYQDLMKAQQRKKKEEKRDETKLGVKLSGRQKSFADTSRYFNVN